MKLRQITVGLLAVFLLTNCSGASPGEERIIPQPQRVAWKNGAFVFGAKTDIKVENDEQRVMASLLCASFSQAAGFTPTFTEGTDASIVFETDTTLLPESYRMEVSDRQIRIRANDNHGFFYALQSIRMQLPPEIESTVPVAGVSWEIPAMEIEDAPRFLYRGLMLDVSRYFIPKETVLKMIDCMAMLKMNCLHLHLVDDNGWRLEIKKYPRLTEVGAWRVAREGDHAQQRNPLPGEATPVGGFYTQDDIREIVSYASARQVEIIPEIEMPAHSLSALAAYPNLACPTVKSFIGVLPGLGGDMAKVAYCAGNDSVFSFLQDVIDEVVGLFPSRYIHLGGDEASKEHWAACPRCQARMKAQDIIDVEDLQGYFMKRMSDYVKSKGRQVMGWDELTNSTIPEGAVIYGWQEMGEAGYKAGQQGHPFIMTPAQVLYLIRYQGPQWFEPTTYFGNNTLKDAYDYEPVRADWDKEAASRLLGIQGSLWTEFVTEPKEVDYLVFPRLAAIAEVAWSPAGAKDWAGFLRRLDGLNRHFDLMGVNYAHSMYNPDHKIWGDNDTLSVSLSCIRPDVEIRYTTDGNEPSAGSALYTGHLTTNKDETIRAATFAQGGKLGQTLTLPVHFNKATAKPITGTGNPALLHCLTNGLRGSTKYTDFEWCGWRDKEISFVIDLQKQEAISRVTIGCITNYGMAVHLPEQIVLSVSNDNRQYTRLTERSYSADQIFREGIRIEDQVFDIPGTTARYLKVDLKSAGKCPKDHIRPNETSALYIDEVIIE